MDYALYKGDEFIDLGTRTELAERLGVAESTIRFYQSPKHRQRSGGRGYIVIPIEEDDE